MRKALLLLVLACTPLLASAIELVSVKDEIAIGREAQQQVKAQLPEVGGDVATYVVSLGRRVVARAGGPRYPYSFSVANYREINAFALPGGPVWINRGVIQAATTEAQLVSVIAHEVAHIAQRHAADQLTKRLVANGLLGFLGAVLGNDGGGARTAQMAAQVLAGGYLLKFSRDDEREADRVGAQIMRRAGWDARAMIDFFETLRKQQGRDPHSVEVFVSTHPAPGERATLLRTQLRGASGGRRNSTEFQQIKARVSKMAPAKPMPR